MAGHKQREKFISERTFSEDQDRFVKAGDKSDDDELRDDVSGIEPFEDEPLLDENANQNARPSDCDSSHEEGEAFSDDDTDLRKIIQTKKASKASTKVKANALTKCADRREDPQPSTSGYNQSLERAQNDNRNFENFMMWMDKYKQFQEWEVNQNRNQEQTAMPTGGCNQILEKVVQSPSESTIYTRMCKSMDSGLGVPPTEQLDISGEILNGQLVVDKLECSSTASTIDDYVNIDINQIDSLILEARRNASREDRKRQAMETSRGPPGKRQRQECVDRRSSQNLGSDDEREVDMQQDRAERESKERRDKILLDVELHRAQLLKPGSYQNLSHLFYDAQHRSLGSHVDKAMESRIVRGEC